MDSYYTHNYEDHLDWDDDEEYLEPEEELESLPATMVYPIPRNESYEPAEESAPWFMFSFPGPGTILAVVIAFMVGVIYLLGSITARWTPEFASSAAEQPLEGVAVVLPDAASEAETTSFVASAEAAAAPCEVSGLFPKKVLRWCNLISYYANHQNLDPDLVAALVWLESGGNDLAYSRSGAVGLMQVMPKDGLAASFMCVNGPCFSDRPSTEELQNPEFNIKYGTRMLARLHNRHGNLREALKSYGPMDVGYYYADKVLGLFKQYGQTP